MFEGDEVPDWCPSTVVCVGGGGGVGVRRRGRVTVTQCPTR